MSAMQDQRKALYEGSVFAKGTGLCSLKHIFRTLTRLNVVMFVLVESGFHMSVCIHADTYTWENWISDSRCVGDPVCTAEA